MFYRFSKRLQNVLAARYFVFVAAVIAVVLTTGTIRSGLQMDDYIHQWKLQSLDLISDSGGLLTDLFSFCDGTLEQYNQRIQMGRLPWWVAKELKTAFFRPVSVVTHWLDYQLWPQMPSLMHVHSLLWFGAMVFAAALFYRRMISPLWVAGLAGLLFAIEDAHGVPAGWLANRNALIAATFGFFSLFCHDRWRRDDWKAGAVLGPVFFLISLLSAEAGLGTGAYLFAYEVFLGKGDWRRRAIRFAPYLLVAALWLVSYKALGYGTFAGGGYIDPGRNPVRYLRHLAERLPVLLFGQWFFPDAFYYGFIPKPQAYYVLAVVCLLVAGLSILFAPLLKRDAVTRFFALGMVLAMLPVCAAFPDNRLLLFAGLGGMGLLATFFGSWFERDAWLPAGRPWRYLARVSVVVLIVVHVVIAPLLLIKRSREMARVESIALEKPLSQISRNHHIDGKTVVFINPPSAFISMFGRVICKELGLQMPRITYSLASGAASAMTVRRIDEQSIEIVPDVGFISLHIDRIYRGQDHPMQVGDRVAMADLTAEVLSLTDDHRPQRVRFTFTRPLEDASFAFFVQRSFPRIMAALPTDAFLDQSHVAQCPPWTYCAGPGVVCLQGHRQLFNRIRRIARSLFLCLKNHFLYQRIAYNRS